MEPLSIDKSRFPYVLRDGKAPICAVYDNKSLDLLARVFIIAEELQIWMQRADSLNMTIELARQKLGQIFTGTSEDNMIDSPVREAYAILESGPVVPQSTAKPKAVAAPPPVLTETDPQIGQIWMTKKKGDRYVILSYKDGLFLLSWLGSYKYEIERTVEQIHRSYTFSGEMQ